MCLVLLAGCVNCFQMIHLTFHCLFQMLQAFLRLGETCLLLVGGIRGAGLIGDKAREMFILNSFLGFSNGWYCLQ